MANSPQARKRAKQNDKRRAHNASLRSLVRTKMKQVLAAIGTGEHGSAQDAYNQAVPVIDRMANKGIINKRQQLIDKKNKNAREVDSIKACRWPAGLKPFSVALECPELDDVVLPECNDSHHSISLR